MEFICTLDACVDCVAYVANDDIPEDRPDLRAEIWEHLGEDARYLANADGLDESGEYYRDGDNNPIDLDHPEYEGMREDWFAWSRCECCGSTLGGMRNRLAVFRAEPVDSIG